MSWHRTASLSISTVYGSFLNLGIIGVILGIYRDNGKENGSYYLGFRVSFPTLGVPFSRSPQKGLEDFGVDIGVSLIWEATISIGNALQEHYPAHMSYSLNSKLISPIIVPYIIPYITPPLGV